MPSTSLFLDIPDSIESNAHNLALDGGGSDSATGKISPIFSTRGRDFFPELSFLLRVDKNGLEGCDSSRNFPWPSPLSKSHYVGVPLTIPKGL